MPMSPHRPTLAGIVLVVLAALGLGSAAVATAQNGDAPRHPIVQAALKYDGTWQDQCWIFVRKVVFEGTGREMGFDYRLGFFEAGAVEVSSKDAAAAECLEGAPLVLQ